MEGWIKLHRQLLEWEWYDEPNTFRLFMHCLLKANHKDNSYRGQLVKAGSFLTSRDLLSSETGLTTQQIRTSLKRLESTNEITTKKSKKGTVLQVVKYTTYQHDNQRSNQKTTNSQPTANQQLTTNNNDNNDNNEKNNNKNSFLSDENFRNKILSDNYIMEVSNMLINKAKKNHQHKLNSITEEKIVYSFKYFFIPSCAKARYKKERGFYNVGVCRDAFKAFILIDFFKPKV